MMNYAGATLTGMVGGGTPRLKSSRTNVARKPPAVSRAQKVAMLNTYATAVTAPILWVSAMMPLQAATAADYQNYADALYEYTSQMPPRTPVKRLEPHPRGTWRITVDNPSAGTAGVPRSAVARLVIPSKLKSGPTPPSPPTTSSRSSVPPTSPVLKPSSTPTRPDASPNKTPPVPDSPKSASTKADAANLTLTPGSESSDSSRSASQDMTVTSPHPIAEIPASTAIPPVSLVATPSSTKNSGASSTICSPSRPSAAAALVATVAPKSWQPRNVPWSYIPGVSYSYSDCSDYSDTPPGSVAPLGRHTPTLILRSIRPPHHGTVSHCWEEEEQTDAEAEWGVCYPREAGREGECLAVSVAGPILVRTRFVKPGETTAVKFCF